MCLRIKTLSLVFICFVQLIEAQQRLTVYNIENGLSGDVVKCITQDAHGFIWIGSDEGLSRFDGKYFVNFNNVLQSNYVKAFCKLKDGRLLVAHDMGINEIINYPDTTFFKNMVGGVNDISKFTDSTIVYPKSLFQDADGNVWIGEHATISRLVGNKLKRYNFSSKDVTSSFSRSFCFVEDGFGNFLVSSYPGNLYFYDKADDSFKEIKTTIKFSYIYGLLQLEPGKIWIGSATGVYEIGIDQNHIIKEVKTITTLEGISCLAGNKEDGIYMGTWTNGLLKVSFSNFGVEINALKSWSSGTINDLFFSTSKDFWLASNDGAILLQNTFFELIELEDFSIHSGDIKYIQSICQGPDSAMYVSVGLAVFKIVINEKGKIFKRILGWNNGFIARIVADKNGLWIGDSFGKIYYYNFRTDKLDEIKNSNPGRYVNYLIEDQKGNIWASEDGYEGLVKITPERKVHLYDVSKKLFGQVNIVKEANDGKIYCGTNNDTAYLFVYEPDKDNFKNLSGQLPFKLKSVFSVNDLAIDEFNNIWLATSAGLLKYQNGKISRIDLGLFHSEETIKALTLSANNCIWLSNSLGIVRYLTGTAMLYNKFSGLPVNTITPKNLFLDYKQRLWTGTAKGLSISKIIDSIQIKTPIPTLLSFKDDAQNIKSGKGNLGKFSYGSLLQCEFVSLIYPCDKIIYQVKIEGKDKDWQMPTTKTDFTFPILNAGNYKLFIRAQQQGNNFEWSQPLIYEFTVKNPWYFTAWGILLVLLIIGIILFILIKYYTYRFKKENEQLEAIVKERTLEVMNQKEILLLQAETLKESNGQLTNQKEKVEKSYENVKLLSRIGQNITSNLSIEKIIDIVYQSINTLMDASVFSIGIYNEKNGLIEYYGAKSKGETLQPFSHDLNDNNLFAVWCLKNNTPILINDYENEYKNYISNPRRLINIVCKSMIFLPLKKQEKSVGVFTVQSFEKNSYSEYHLDILRNLANYVTIAIENAETYHQIEIQKGLIEKKNEDITSSINYASRIQEAILPSKISMSKVFSDFFIYYKPRDIVSGDFYWFTKLQDKIIIAAVDCTGHGVPGAFMSLIGNMFLNQIINSLHIFHPDLILKELHHRIRRALRQETTKNNDGMDASICLIDKNNNTLEYAGAKNPLLYIQDNKLNVIKGDNRAIGGYQKEKERFFTNHKIDISTPTKIYIYSDGFQDQFGGDQKRKFLSSRFRELLFQTSSNSLENQEKLVNQSFIKWMGNQPQLDDILLIGVDLATEKINLTPKVILNWVEKTILVALSNDLNYITIKNAVSMYKPNLIRIKEGIKAIDMVTSEQKFDLILIDAILPDLDGIKVIQKIRETNKEIPVVLLTSYHIGSQYEDGIRAGCDDYVSRPINQSDLIHILTKHLVHSRKLNL